MMRLPKTLPVLLSLLLLILTGALYQGCQKELIPPDTAILPFTTLSDYEIYQGNPTELIPTTNYKLYELSSQLFTDYAEKQRLIRLPEGTKLTVINDGLLNFPEGTIIVKTFYYVKNQRNSNGGKELIETRILQLIKGKWVAGTYLWNDSQTDATLIGTGLDKTVNWINEGGKGEVISYHIPSNFECKTCHNSNQTIVPIGPKVRNLNFEVFRNTQTLNQLTHLANERILNFVNPNNYSEMPDYNDPSISLENRARAYLDINCAHCHSEGGFGSQYRYRMGYETDLNTSQIKSGKAAIMNMIENGDMPKIGTTLTDNEGIELIKKYLDTI